MFLHAEVVVAHVLGSLSIAETFQRDFVFSRGKGAGRQVDIDTLCAPPVLRRETAKGQDLFTAASLDVGAKSRIVVPCFELDLDMCDLRREPAPVVRDAFQRGKDRQKTRDAIKGAGGAAAGLGCVCEWAASS